LTAKQREKAKENRCIGGREGYFKILKLTVSAVIPTTPSFSLFSIGKTLQTHGFLDHACDGQHGYQVL
jgi:hypothetical protein